MGTGCGSEQAKKQHGTSAGSHTNTDKRGSFELHVVKDPDHFTCSQKMAGKIQASSILSMETTWKEDDVLGMRLTRTARSLRLSRSGYIRTVSPPGHSRR